MQTRVPVLGNTYPVRAEIKAIGGKWDFNLKMWLVTKDKLAAANEIVRNAPASAPRPAKQSSGSSFGFAAGK